MSSENQHVCPRKFKFFRVLLLGFSTKLAIPQRLTKHFIEHNLTLVTFLSPLGKSWNVKISGNNVGLQFEEGWERFAAAHRLSFGDLLVFKYVGGTVFHVTIFDKSTCEKDYKVTYGSVHGVDHVPGQGENYDQEYAECFKGKTTSTAPSSGQKTPPVMEQELYKDWTQVPVGKEVQKPVHKATKKATYKHVCKTGSRFEITISSKLKYAVKIPVKVSRTNDLSSIHQMFLRDSEGHLWPVKLIPCNQSGFGKDRLLLSAGWRDFCIGNELKDGDVCIFELKKKNEMFVQIHRSCTGGAKYTNQDEIKSTNSYMYVLIFSITCSCDTQDGSSGSKSTLQQAVQSKVTRTCKQADPLQFRSTIVPSNVRQRGYMTIPSAFVSSVSLSTEKEVVLVNAKSREWSVKILYHEERRWCRTSGHGWMAFCEENNVEVGDVCIFSFKYRGREATFQVEVIKLKAADASSGSKSNPLQQAVQLKRAATLQQVGSPSKVSRTRKQADPVQFRSTIVPTNVGNWCYMTIPMAFLSLVDLSIEKEVVLVDPNSREWPVKILYDEKRRWCRMSHGWTAFCGENDVEAGDVCVFSFKYRGREATFQVEVIKSKAADGSSKSKCPGLQQAAQLKRAATLQQKGSPSEVTRRSKPADPVQFSSTIVPINVCKQKGYMNIPRAFRSLVDLSAEKEVILVDPNSRRWPVKIYHCRIDGRCRMDGAGWVRFCGGNDLKVGDVCCFNFEYGSGREATFQVEVIKSKNETDRKL